VTLVGLRRFNDLGIETVEAFLGQYRLGMRPNFGALLDRDELTTVISSSQPLTPGTFSSRWECARFFFDLLEAHKESLEIDPERDRGLWTWLAIAWRGYLMKPGSGDDVEWHDYRWVLSLDYKRFYKHLLAGPWLVYRIYAHDPEQCRVLLQAPILNPGHEITEQIACRLDLVRAPSVVRALEHLYLKPSRDGYKRSASRRATGSIRRFSEILQQFALTYDFYSMSPDQILGLLPKEFDTFRR
jgi:hypothetical protein